MPSSVWHADYWLLCLLKINGLTDARTLGVPPDYALLCLVWILILCAHFTERWDASTLQRVAPLLMEWRAMLEYLLLLRCDPDHWWEHGADLSTRFSRGIWMPVIFSSWYPSSLLPPLGFPHHLAQQPHHRCSCCPSSECLLHWSFEAVGVVQTD